MPAGLPHSEIQGSTLTSSSPWLIAGSHVLLRLSMPRHPPCALCSLTCFSFRQIQRRSPRRSVYLVGRVQGFAQKPFIDIILLSMSIATHTHQHRKISSHLSLSRPAACSLTRSIVAFSKLFSFQRTSNSWTPPENRIGNRRTVACGLDL